MYDVFLMCVRIKTYIKIKMRRNGDIEIMADLEYPKIDTLYNRDGGYFVNVLKLRRPEFGNIKIWYLTEKIHGMNTRVTLLSNGKVIYGGKTDEAEMPPELIEYLKKTFTQEKMEDVFWLPDKPVPKSVTIYGEGYGPKMVPGSGIYRSDVSFRLFDCFVKSEDGNWWLERHNLEDIAEKLGIKCVPMLGIIDFLPVSIEEIERIFSDNIRKLVATEESGKVGTIPEGIVAKTEPSLFNRKGERVMWKLKIKDFKKTH
jgi:ATP-dependent RNA circularization protein (DNA/RNA ligase family)